jgi:putative PIN family toxin of toxin-antitoxin system
VRAVLDPNILVASLLSRRGAPAQIISRWLAGDFEVVISGALLAELERAFSYSKPRSRIADEEAQAFIAILRQGALVAADPPNPPRRSSDPGDDYLLALAEQERAILVSGDQHLLALASEFPILTARAFLDISPTCNQSDLSS